MFPLGDGGGVADTPWCPASAVVAAVVLILVFGCRPLFLYRVSSSVKPPSVVVLLGVSCTDRPELGRQNPRRKMSTSAVRLAPGCGETRTRTK